MRRALVLTADFARHPFRASLPAHVYRAEEASNEPEGLAQLPANLRQFLQVYIACLVGVSAFIA